MIKRGRGSGGCDLEFATPNLLADFHSALSSHIGWLLARTLAKMESLGYQRRPAFGLTGAVVSDKSTAPEVPDPDESS